MSLLAAAAITGAASVLGSGANAVAGGNSNKKNRAFQEEMYKTQQKDNLMNWNMQNDYNSPQKQMERLQAAGLNPNLIYGNGGGVGNAPSSPQSPDKPNYTHKPQNYSAVGDLVGGYFDTKMKQAQLDNLKAQNTSIIEDSLLKQAQRKNIEFSTDFKTDTRHADYELSMHRANKMGAENSISQSKARTLFSTENETIENAAQKIIQNKLGIEKSKAEIQKLKNDVNFQKLDLDLKKNGINPNDEIYWRVLGRVLKNAGISID